MAEEKLQCLQRKAVLWHFIFGSSRTALRAGLRTLTSLQLPLARSDQSSCDQSAIDKISPRCTGKETLTNWRKENWAGRPAEADAWVSQPQSPGGLAVQNGGNTLLQQAKHHVRLCPGSGSRATSFS